MAAQNLFQQTSRWNDSITRLQRGSMFWVNIRLIGIELVASLFEADDVPVSLIAGVATAEPVRQMLLEKLKTSESMKKLISRTSTTACLRCRALWNNGIWDDAGARCVGEMETGISRTLGFVVINFLMSKCNNKLHPHKFAGWSCHFLHGLYTIFYYSITQTSSGNVPSFNQLSTKRLK